MSNEEDLALMASIPADITPDPNSDVCAAHNHPIHITLSFQCERRTKITYHTDGYYETMDLNVSDEEVLSWLAGRVRNKIQWDNGIKDHDGKNAKPYRDLYHVTRHAGFETDADRETIPQAIQCRKKAASETLKTNPECAVCLEVLNPETVDVAAPINCPTHLFHLKCLVESCKNSTANPPTCPMDRTYSVCWIVKVGKKMYWDETNSSPWTLPPLLILMRDMPAEARAYHALQNQPRCYICKVKMHSYHTNLVAPGMCPDHIFHRACLSTYYQNEEMACPTCGLPSRVFWLKHESFPMSWLLIKDIKCEASSKHVCREGICKRLPR